MIIDWIKKGSTQQIEQTMKNLSADPNGMSMTFQLQYAQIIALRTIAEQNEVLIERLGKSQPAKDDDWWEECEDVNCHMRNKK